VKKKFIVKGERKEYKEKEQGKEGRINGDYKNAR